MLEKVAIYVVILVLACAASFMKGCEYEQDKQDAANAKQQAENDIESARRITAQTQAKKEAENERKKLAADKAVALAAANGMRNQLECARDPACNPAIGTGSKAVTALADVFGECQSRYVGMAEKADTSWIAGSLCEKSYDALSPREAIRKQVRGTK